MNCDLANEAMMKYFDKECNDIETAQLKQHIKTCSTCRDYFTELSGIFELLESDSGIEPPQDFEDKVMAKVAMVEKKSMKESERTVAVMYGVSTMLLVAMSVMLIMDLGQLDLLGIISSIAARFTASAGMLATVTSIFDTFTVLGKGVLMGLLQAALVIAKAYFYVFIALAVMFVIIQKKLIELVMQDHGGTK